MRTFFILGCSALNRFKEFSRPRAERKEKKGVSPIKQVKSPGLTLSIGSPSVPAGENTVSFERHTNYFKLILRKQQGTIELLVNIFHLILKSMLNFFILFHLGDLIE